MTGPNAAAPVVLVCGGRDFGGFGASWLLDEVLTRVALRYPGFVLRHGDARGADRMAGDWAAHHGHEQQRFPADWGRHGRAAGPIRNRAMLQAEPRPALVVAFPGGRGTADMVAQARAAGIPVEVVPMRTGGTP